MNEKGESVAVEARNDYQPRAAAAVTERVFSPSCENAAAHSVMGGKLPVLWKTVENHWARTVFELISYSGERNTH